MDKQTLAQAVGTGVIFTGIASAQSGMPMSMLVKNGAISAGADLASGEVANTIIPWVLPSLASDSMYAKPLASGLAYVAADYLIKSDQRSLLSKFFIQVGSSVASSYVVAPFVK
jgi:hypothetical protein